MTSLVVSLTLGLILIGLFYFGFIVIAGFRALRQLRTQPSPVGSTGPTRVFFLVPCLNEEKVIGPTVAALASTRTIGIVVVDDGSDDDTAAVARAAGGRLVQVCERRLPEARQGKGAALNAGLALVRRTVRRARWDPATVLVGVMDADGRLSPGALDVVRPLFANPSVGGAQLAVRIRNRQRLLPRIQDWEFWGLAALSQYARHGAATVSLGGNGQFTRLSALNALRGPVWSASLTEDLDLALRLTAAGSALVTTPAAYVDQQGLTSLRALSRQRTRWFQGHLACSAHIPTLARAPRLSAMGFQELVLYLLFPFVVMLPWSLVWVAALPATTHLLTAHRPALVAHSAAATQAAIVGAWYLFSFFPTIVAGVAYHRRDPACSRLKAQLLAHVAFVAQPFYWWCCWRAAYRLLRGANGWEKTPRVHENPAPIRALIHS